MDFVSVRPLVEDNHLVADQACTGGLFPTEQVSKTCLRGEAVIGFVQTGVAPAEASSVFSLM
jgi:hypothetical protein